MASFKNVNSDYTLTCDNGNGTFTINAQTVFSGNVTYTVPATTVTPFLTVAANNTGAITDMGLLGQTGPTTFAGLRFDTIVGAWQTSNNVYANGEPITSYANIGSIPAGLNTQVQFNDNGVFGAVANLAYNTSNSQLIINGSQRFGNIGAIPANVANSVVMYSNSVGQGGTGLYFTSAAAQGELVSRRNAIIYGIIF